MIAALLIVAVLFAWIGCLGFARFPSAYDRIHCVTFVAVTSGAAVTIAAFCADGLSDRALKIALFYALTVLNGAGRGACQRPGVDAARSGRRRVTIWLATLFVLLAGTGAGVALSRNPVRQVLAIAGHGLVLTLLFLALQAPDVRVLGACGRHRRAAAAVPGGARQHSQRQAAAMTGRARIILLVATALGPAARCLYRRAAHAGLRRSFDALR